MLRMDDFRFVARAEWGASPFRGAPSPLRTPREIVLHHSVIPGGVRAIQAFHQDTRGWQDIGYHFVVDRFGDDYAVFEGRVIDDCGAHVGHRTVGRRSISRNLRRLGVCVVDDFRFDRPTPSLERCLRALVRALAARYPALRRVRGHHLGPQAIAPGAGECPGPALVPLIERLQAELSASANAVTGTKLSPPEPPAPWTS